MYPEEIEDLFQLYDQVEQILIRGYQEEKDIPSELIEAVIYPRRNTLKEKRARSKRSLIG